jgi:hypothetical protein
MQELGDNRAPLGSIKRNTDDNKITTKTSRVSPGLSIRALKSKDPKKQLIGLLARRKQGLRKKKADAGAGKESVLPSMYMATFSDRNADSSTRRFWPWGKAVHATRALSGSHSTSASARRSSAAGYGLKCYTEAQIDMYLKLNDSSSF